MSVTTTADENVNKVRHNIKNSVELLHEILIRECWGYDEYTIQFTEQMWETYNQLIELKKIWGSPKW